MKITKLELFKVPPRWLFLKISTDEGICGWGEPVVEGRAESTAAAVRDLEHHLLGRDPRRIEELFQTLYRGTFYRGGPILMSAISGVEQALWDIKGKYHNMPVYDMLGGPCRDRIKVYAWIGGDNPEPACDDARKRVAQGFRAIKMNATGICPPIGASRVIDAAVARVGKIREALGDDVDIALDFHGRVSKTVAKTLVRELERFRPLFYEEPVLAEQPEALAELARNHLSPLATGERQYGRWGFKDLISAGAVDIIQPDPSHAGGIFECRKIAAMAEAYDISVALHAPLGPIATVAALHIDACTPNCVIQEFPLSVHYNTNYDLLDYLVNKEIFAVKDGFVSIPSGPGLGIEIDEEKVRDAVGKAPDWKVPTWKNEDGSFAEW